MLGSVIVNLDEQRLFPDFEPGDVIASEVVEHAQPANERSIVRRVALQVLYEIDSSGHRVGEVIGTHLDHNDLSERGERYLQQLVIGITKNRENLDAIIQKYAPEWPLDQVAIIDRNILRIAVYELGIETRIPLKVAIDEAVQLAKLFGAEGSARFVNGVLGSLSDDYDDIRKQLVDGHTKQ